MLLANANDADSLRSTRADLEFVKSLGKVAYVVATYMSMAGEEMTAKQITKALGLEARTPVLPCQLRDRESVTGVVRAALDLAGAPARRLNRAPAGSVGAAASRPTLVCACDPRATARTLTTRLSSSGGAACADDRWTQTGSAGPARRKDTTACTTPATA